MSKHIHAELMAQYAQDAMETDKPWERWEVKTCEHGGWYTPETEIPFHAYTQYRRKPRTININGHEVPEPAREPLEYGTSYFVPSVTSRSLRQFFEWADSDPDHRYLERGLIHLTEDAAIAHAKALLSFTTKPEASHE